MSASWFVLMLLLQLATQHVAPAGSSTAAAEQQHELVETADSMTPTHGRQLAAVRSRGTFGGFSRPRTSTSSYRPVGGSAFSGARLPGGTRLPGGFTGYRRSGFRSTPFILPLALGSGLLAGAAISSLNNNPNAYCNGGSVQCYLAACEDALRNRCPDAAAESNNTLVLTACPDPRYSECYATPTFNDTDFTSFECFGARRPRYGREDLAAVCHQPGFDSSAGAARLSKVLHVLLPCAVGLLLLLGL